MKNKYLLLAVLGLFLTNLTAQQFNNKDYKITWLIKDNKFTLVDVQTQQEIIPPTYDEARLFTADISMVRVGDYYGFVSSKGENLTALEYEGVWDYNEKLILVQQQGKYKFLHKASMTNSVLGFADVMEDNDEVDYDQVIFSHGDDFAIVMLDDRYGYINRDGQEVIPLMFENATLFDDGVATVQFNGKWGVIDKDGNQLVDFKYDQLSAFTSGVSVAKKGKKWGVINPYDKAILPFKYKYLTHFNDAGIAIAKRGKKWGIINPKGEIIAPFEYEYDAEYASLLDLTEDYIWIKQDTKWGTLDLNGNPVIPFEYDQIHTFDGDEARIWKDGKLMLIDMEGNCLENCGEQIFFDFDN